MSIIVMISCLCIASVRVLSNQLIFKFNSFYVWKMLLLVLSFMCDVSDVMSQFDFILLLISVLCWRYWPHLETSQTLYVYLYSNVCLFVLDTERDFFSMCASERNIKIKRERKAKNTKAKARKKPTHQMLVALR